jgi:Cft2 family RNA processing exonuclease
VEDGGLKYDAPYLLDYLEALTPDGEKPIIDAWFLSHSHDDHVGAILEIAQNEVYRERIRVEGIYFTPHFKEFFYI